MRRGGVSYNSIYFLCQFKIVLLCYDEVIAMIKHVIFLIKLIKVLPHSRKF